MKKGILFFALILFIVVGAYSIGIGGGAVFDGGFGAKPEGAIEALNNLTFGGFAFVDIVYVEASVSVALGSLTGITNGTLLYQYIGTENINFAKIGLSALFKYPLKLGFLSIFPALGAGYNFTIPPSGTSIDPFDLNEFFALAGAGVDINIGSSLFFRGTALLKVTIPSTKIRELLDPDAAIGFGPRIQVGIGYRF